MPSAIIVEDEVLASERLRVLLDECNIVLLKTFHHAQPALDWLSMHEADIVFADIGLPEITGLELVERIKRIAKKQPEIIFTTAYEEHALRAFELAAADYLLKPIKLSRLQTALARVNEKIKEQEDDFTISKYSTAIEWWKFLGSKPATYWLSIKPFFCLPVKASLMSCPKPWFIGKSCSAKKLSGCTAMPWYSATRSIACCA